MPESYQLLILGWKIFSPSSFEETSQKIECFPWASSVWKRGEKRNSQAKFVKREKTFVDMEEWRRIIHNKSVEKHWHWGLGQRWLNHEIKQFVTEKLRGQSWPFRSMSSNLESKDKGARVYYRMWVAFYENHSLFIYYLNTLMYAVCTLLFIIPRLHPSIISSFSSGDCKRNITPLSTNEPGSHKSLFLCWAELETRILW